MKTKETKKDKAWRLFKFHSNRYNATLRERYLRLLIKHRNDWYQEIRKERQRLTNAN